MTGDTLENLLAGATRDFHAAADKKAHGENEAARRLFLQTAEKLMRAAGQSQGSLRETRKKLAEEMLAEAQALKTAPGKTIASAGAKTHSSSIGDDEQAASWQVQEKPDVKFEDVAGLEEVKSRSA